MRTLQEIGLRFSEWWFFSTFSKDSIGGLTLNLVFITPHIPLITTWLSSLPQLSSLLLCLFSEPELTNKNSLTSSTWRKSQRRTKDKEMREPRLRTKLTKRLKQLTKLICEWLLINEAETIFTHYEKVEMKWEYYQTSLTNERVFILSCDQITEI